MRALEHPYVPVRAGLLDGTPVAALVVLAAAWSLAALALPAPEAPRPRGAPAARALPAPEARAIGLAAGHGALLGTALAWTAADGARERWAPLEAALLL